MTYVPDIPELSDCFPAQFIETMKTGYDEKRLIAQYAVEQHIKDGARLLIDTGGTSTIFARKLAESGLQNVQITTHSLTVSLQFSNAPGFIVNTRMGPSAEFNRAEMAFYPETSPKQFSPFGGDEFDCVLTAESFRFDSGITTRERDVRRLTQFYIRHSRRVYLLMHGQKFERPSRRNRISWCGLDADRWLRTDKKFWLITEAARGQEPSEMTKLMRRPNITHSRGKGQYEQVVEFRGTLRREKS